MQQLWPNHVDGLCGAMKVLRVYFQCISSCSLTHIEFVVLSKCYFPKYSKLAKGTLKYHLHSIQNGQNTKLMLISVTIGQWGYQRPCVTLCHIGSWRPVCSLANERSVHRATCVGPCTSLIWLLEVTPCFTWRTWSLCNYRFEICPADKFKTCPKTLVLCQIVMVAIGDVRHVYTCPPQCGQ